MFLKLFLEPEPVAVIHIDHDDDGDDDDADKVRNVVLLPAVINALSSNSNVDSP